MGGAWSSASPLLVFIDICTQGQRVTLESNQIESTSLAGIYFLGLIIRPVCYTDAFDTSVLLVTSDVRNLVGLRHLSQLTWWELWSGNRIRHDKNKLEMRACTPRRT